MIKNKFNEQKAEYLWNNIIKIGYDKKGFPYNFYENIVKPHFNKIIIEEINILKPDYCVFLTGPDSNNGPYDTVINDVFNTPNRKKINGFKVRELCIIELENVQKSFRTYHPNYLYRNGIDKYYKELLNEL